MLTNTNYKQTLDNAVIENNDMMRKDDGNWFYKKWKELFQSSSDRESMLERKMKAVKEQYRSQYEEARMMYPTANGFNRMKQKIEQCRLFHVFQEMPKGGLLHVHSAAALSLDGLMDLLKDWKRDVVYIVYEKAEGNKQLPGTLFFGVSGITMPGVAELKEFLTFPGGEEQLREWLGFENADHMEDIIYTWDEFNRIFMRTGGLFSNREFYKEYHKRFFKECIRDKIKYVELRCGFQEFDNLMEEERKNPVYDYCSNFLDVLKEARQAAVAEEKKEYAGCKEMLKYCDIECRVILCARRDLDAWDDKQRQKLSRKVDAAIYWKGKAEYQYVIAGFDFVSEEDRGKNTYSYYNNILYANAFEDDPDNPVLPGSQVKLGVPRIQQIDFYLHAGESLWTGEENVIDAKIACKFRIGHGFQMAQYPSTIDGYLNAKEPTGPVLEICPISNQLLGYFKDIRTHYFYILAKLGVPCVLGNDDPQILGNPGLSYDFWEIYMGSDGSLSLIKGLVYTAYVFYYAYHIRKDVTDMSAQDFTDCLNEFLAVYWNDFVERALDIVG